ncbi:hypothetical protein L3X38_013061 [Prunus dulcis]|uniref:Uncharacterized protein n=1 Tax=Prunus dulcis TaxID=3755 RepID=A0AAD4WM59_PRUDU|nr:hypothetical protein L3X38_013059 [Prunus dulcis]KAI5345184.1 hypothetical protein L3X38_013061 [Prunus dulcis]
MSKNFNFNKTEFKGNNMKKESYEGSRLGSARSGSAAELSQLLAGGGAKQKIPARTVDNLKTRTSVISPTRADYPIKGLQQHPVKDAPGSDSSKYLKYPYPSSKSGEPHRPRPRAATRAGSAWVCREISGDGKISTPELTLPATDSTRRVEHIIQLHQGPIRTASGRNRRRKLTVLTRNFTASIRRPPSPWSSRNPGNS